ncbi:MAG TPA: ribonuclease III [Thermodesulfobacteriota bacterium]
MSRPATLGERLGHAFARAALLETALTHRSYAEERAARGEPTADNERLEFLGDAVVDLAVSRMLIVRLPDAPEGRLSTLRAAVVNERSLAAAARALGVGEALRLGRGEERSGGRDKPSILADTFEALVGAVFLDGGWDAASALVEAHLAGALEDALAGRIDADHKTRLQELQHQRGGPAPVYTLAAASGPDHARVFDVEVAIGGEVLGRGRGSTKKEAEQQAAAAALAALADPPRDDAPPDRPGPGR